MSRLLPREPRRQRPLAPGLERLLAGDPDPTSLFVPSGLRSVRGIEVASRLLRLDLPAEVNLAPVARLPRLRELHVHERGDRTVRLGPLRAAPALEELHIHGGRVVETGALAELRTLRVVELSFLRSPDLRPLARLPLRRLVLDGVSGVRLHQLDGLGVEQLDLWGCTIPDLAPLAAMPALREVWIHLERWNHPGPRSLAPLMHVLDGARIVLDGSFDPELERERLAVLEARGVWVWAGDEPHENGVHPSWWGPCPGLEQEEREAPRYVTRR